MLLKDKVIIITGVGPGMGAKMAVIAAEEGAKVVLAARNEERLNTFAEAARTKGADVLAVPADISDADSCQNLAAEAVKKFGRIDGLVNSAYKHAGFAPAAEANLDVWRDCMETTFFGTMQMTQAVVPQMKQQGGGAIVNVNTMATRKPMAGEGGYAAAKAAIASSTRFLALELGPYNIRVNTTFMGWLWGASVEGYVKYTAKQQKISEEQVIKTITDRIPLGVVPPDEECGKTVLTFVSDYTKMVTGASLDVNGGEYMPA